LLRVFPLLSLRATGLHVTKPTKKGKKGKSAFLLFSKAKRKAVPEGGAKLSFTDIGAMWSALSDANKAEWKI
jgi:hypothetical protein